MSRRPSCSDKLDWEYRFRSRFLVCEFLIFGLFFLLLVLFSTFAWMQVSGDTFFVSLYWAVQTFTTVGYGAELQWREHSYLLAIVWMLTSTIYWAGVVGVVVARVTDWLKR